MIKLLYKFSLKYLWFLLLYSRKLDVIYLERNSYKNYFNNNNTFWSVLSIGIFEIIVFSQKNFL